MWPLQWGYTGRDRHQHAGQADQDRRYPCGDRDHAGREDRLHRRLASTATVTPVATATNTPGKPIKIGGVHPAAIAITPDGKTAYSLRLGGGRYGHAGRTATNTPGKPIKIGGIPCGDRDHAGREDRLRRQLLPGATTVTPVATATNTPGRPIKIGGGFPQAVAIAITPDGKTAYVVRASVREQRSPRSRPPPTRRASRSTSAVSAARRVTAIAITPDGKTAYIADGNHHGHTGRDRHQHAGQADQDQRYPCGDRDHAGREDRLHRHGRLPRRELYRVPSWHGHTGRDRHQHAGQADQHRPRP